MEQRYGINHTKVNLNTLFWEEIFNQEKMPFERQLQKKCKLILGLERRIDELMIDPIANEEQLRDLYRKLKFFNQDNSASYGLLKASEVMRDSYISHTCDLLEIIKKKEYQISLLKSRLARVVLQLANYAIQEAEEVKEGRKNVL